MSSNI
jgi:hypothetical protein